MKIVIELDEEKLPKSFRGEFCREEILAFLRDKLLYNENVSSLDCDVFSQLFLDSMTFEEE